MKIVCLWSGGIDSTTMVYYLVTKYNPEEMHLLSFNYGQKHAKEIESCKKILPNLVERFGYTKFEHKVVDITSIHELIAKGSLVGDEEIPHAFYTEETQKSTIVPNRNMILLAIATGYAVKIGAQKVCYAAHYSDYSIYPDCRKEFVKALDTAIYLGNIWDKVELEAPFVDLTKKQVVGLGIKLNVPYHLTWSCYSGLDRPCLSCGTCLERTESFLLNDVKDPALTDEEWEKAVEIYKKCKTCKSG
jgi:7-cyano-7-deazaguanine synthase